MKNTTKELLKQISILVAVFLLLPVFIFVAAGYDWIPMAGYLGACMGSLIFYHVKDLWNHPFRAYNIIWTFDRIDDTTHDEIIAYLEPVNDFANYKSILFDVTLTRNSLSIYTNDKPFVCKMLQQQMENEFELKNLRMTIQ